MIQINDSKLAATEGRWSDSKKKIWYEFTCRAFHWVKWHGCVNNDTECVYNAGERPRCIMSPFGSVF